MLESSSTSGTEVPDREEEMVSDNDPFGAIDLGEDTEDSDPLYLGPNPPMGTWMKGHE